MIKNNLKFYISIILFAIIAIYILSLLIFPLKIFIEFNNSFDNSLDNLTDKEKTEISFLFKKKYCKKFYLASECNISIYSFFEPKNFELDYLYLIRGTTKIISPFGFHYLDTGENSWGFVLAKKDINSKWELVADKLCCAMGEEWH